MTSDRRRLFTALRQAGWTITRTGGGHWRLRAPSGKVVFAADTPSDHRSRLNMLRDLRRAGWHPPKRHKRKNDTHEH